MSQVLRDKFSDNFPSFRDRDSQHPLGDTAAFLRVKRAHREMVLFSNTVCAIFKIKTPALIFRTDIPHFSLPLRLPSHDGDDAPRAAAGAAHAVAGHLYGRLPPRAASCMGGASRSVSGRFSSRTLRGVRSLLSRKASLGHHHTLRVSAAGQPGVVCQPSHTVLLIVI